MKPERLKKVIREEYLKSAQNPVYFLKKYCVIQHPLRGKIPFHLYPFQEKSIQEFEQNHYG